MLKRLLLPLSFPFMLLSGCAMGPDYKKPEVKVPTAFRQATPADEELAKRWQAVDYAKLGTKTGAWWKDWWQLPDDHELAQRLALVAEANPNVELVAAQYRQADALLSGARASWWPSLSTGVSSSRGEGIVGSTVTTGGEVKVTDKVSTTLSWEMDLWGRIGRGVESNQAAKEASAADLQAAILSAQMAFAQSYLQWQSNHQQQNLLDRSLKTYARTLEMARSRYEAGVASRTDVLQAETQLNGTRAQLLDLGIQQAQLEHAMAVLLGKAPSELAAPKLTGLPTLPSLPAMLPSQILLARPDVAAAERRVAAANAQIGVAQAAFFPTLTLGSTLGYQDNTFSNIVSAPNRFWSFGPSLALTLFDGGARSAAKIQAQAVHAQRTASYRQTVLTAFQEVEDQLAALRILASEEEMQVASASAAQLTTQITEHQYQAGVVAYLNVLNAQVVAMSAERTLLDVQLRRLLASIALIKAVGGNVQVPKTEPGKLG